MHIYRELYNEIEKHNFHLRCSFVGLSMINSWISNRDDSICNFYCCKQSLQLAKWSNTLLSAWWDTGRYCFVFSCEQTIIWTPLSICPWWRHQMETFFALLAICAGNSPVPGEFPTQRPVTRSFDVYFDLRPNKRLSKQSWGWWFETLSWSLWRHCNVSPFLWKCKE